MVFVALLCLQLHLVDYHSEHICEVFFLLFFRLHEQDRYDLSSIIPDML